jgi:FdhD protein
MPADDATPRIKRTLVVEWRDTEARQIVDEVAVEEPLEIRVNGTAVSITMRTPGDDIELAVGFLFTERLIAGPQDVADVGYASDSNGGPSANVVDVTLRPGRTIDLARLQRHFYAASSCGVCGKASICAVRVPDIARPSEASRIDPTWLYGLPDALRAVQTVFDRTGGLHAAALFDAGGTLIAIREDIGRHNAVDKIIGHALLAERLPLSHHVLFVSGRGAFEIVQKSLVAGVPILASVSAPSSLAVDLAREHGLTLIGFLRGARFVVYAGDQRLAIRQK